MYYTYKKCGGEPCASYQKNQLDYVNISRPSDMSSLLCDSVFNKKKKQKIYIMYMYVCMHMYIYAFDKRVLVVFA